MSLAVITTGGKQYLVSPGDKIKIEKIDQKEGEEIIFEQVLLLEKENNLAIGQPVIKGAKVKAKILKQGKHKKITLLKHRPKKRYQKKMGHRQPFSEVEIKTIDYKLQTLDS